MILSVEEYRTLDAADAFEDEALQALLDATEAEIVRAAGGTDSVTEFHAGGGGRLALLRPASSITSITETDSAGGVVTLAADDYLLYPAGVALERLSTGTNPGSRWYGRVTVTYVPADQDALRRGVQYDLMKLTMSYNPGLTSEQVGQWTRSFASNSAWNTDEERQAILARLLEGPSMVPV